jgi:hypothetical protein
MSSLRRLLSVRTIVFKVEFGVRFGSVKVLRVLPNKYDKIKINMLKLFLFIFFIRN